VKAWRVVHSITHCGVRFSLTLTLSSIDHFCSWEYTARMFLHQYRFDAVFAADRFGSILQYIQSGMEDYKPDAPRNDEAI
jgi:hypothetical protein